jgi:hypothetical protein
LHNVLNSLRYVLHFSAQQCLYGSA